MQSYALTVDKFLDHAARWFGHRQVVTASADAPLARIGYAEVRERANRLSGALASLGLAAGDRIGTLAWNTQHHFEAYFAIMGAGMVCHTLNPRLTAAHLAAIVNEAENRAIAVGSDLGPLLAELLPMCPGLEHVILMDGAEAPAKGLAGSRARVWVYEELLAERGAPADWGGFDEETACGLCYTSGTTGRPKGVLYTHRSNYLHTLRCLQADAVALTAEDSVLAAVPMFHANGWGLPFCAAAAGSKFILPGRQTDGARLAGLMLQEKVTVAVGVHTVWLGVLDHLDAVGGDLPDLKRILVGGSNCPDAVIRRMEERLGAQVQTSWGMTELSPMGVIAPPGAQASATRGSGRPPMGMDMKLTDAAGRDLPQQRGPVGHLKVKGGSVVDRYYKADEPAADAEGWFDTGDLASIDEDGNLSICGRAKDLIKSGGEWINPAEMEDIVGRHPAVGQVAVIGRPDPKWGERPVLVVELRPGEAVDDAGVLDALRGKVPTWWLPDRIVRVEAMPLAATGKIDKTRLRADYAEGDIAGQGSRS